jgi:hypothetical protein
MRTRDIICTATTVVYIKPHTYISELSSWTCYLKTNSKHTQNSEKIRKVLNINTQTLKIIWQGWYVARRSLPKCWRNSRCTVVTESIFANCRIQSAFCCGVAILQHGLPWWRQPETLSCVNCKQTSRVFLITVVYRVIVGSLVTSL